jgi:hypothetical protein
MGEGPRLLPPFCGIRQLAILTSRAGFQNSVGALWVAEQRLECAMRIRNSCLAVVNAAEATDHSACHQGSAMLACSRSYWSLRSNSKIPSERFSPLDGIDRQQDCLSETAI